MPSMRVTRIVGTHCTVQRHTGEFCDALSAEDVPFPICARHAMKLYRHVQAMMLSADPMAAVFPLLMEAEDRRARAVKPKHAMIYYVQVGDLIKIGYTVNLALRLRDYPPNRRLLATEPGSTSVESARHERFASLRAHGHEWYHPGTELINHINRLREASGASAIPLDQPA